MIKGIYAAGVAAALGVAMPLLVPVEVAARSGGAGMGAHFSPAAMPAHFAKWHGHHNRHAFHRGRFSVLVAGIAPDYAGEANGDALGALDSPVLRPRCRHSVETVTVPAEAGGNRQILITRC